jgi:hypothetical protein
MCAPGAQVAGVYPQFQDLESELQEANLSGIEPHFSKVGAQFLVLEPAFYKVEPQATAVGAQQFPKLEPLFQEVGPKFHAWELHFMRRGNPSGGAQVSELEFKFPGLGPNFRSFRN